MSDNSFVLKLHWRQRLILWIGYKLPMPTMPDEPVRKPRLRDRLFGKIWYSSWPFCMYCWRFAPFGAHKRCIEQEDQAYRLYIAEQDALAEAEIEAEYQESLAAEQALHEQNLRDDENDSDYSDDSEYFDDPEGDDEDDFEDEDPLAGDVDPTGGYYDPPLDSFEAQRLEVMRQHGDYTG